MAERDTKEQDTAGDRQRPAVALLGTGLMGAGMGRNLARAGLPLRVWNRTQAKAEALAADGAFVAATPAEAVREADVIVTMLADGDTVAGVLADAAPGLRSGQVWAQASTVGVAATDALARLAGEHGLVFVDSPVLGTRQPAEDGKLTVLAAGPDAARAVLEPVFGAIGQRTLWTGEPGSASRLKLVLNNWVLAVTLGTAESMALAEGLGADPALFLEAVSGGPLDLPYLHAKSSAIRNEDYAPSFSVDLAHKDAELIVAAGQAAGLPTDLAELAGRKLAQAAGLGHGGDDMAAMYFACLGSVRP